MSVRNRAAVVAVVIGLFGWLLAGPAPTASAATYSCSNTHISGNTWQAGYYSGMTVIPSKTGVSAAGIEAQCILKSRGYNPGTIDGVFGPNSREAMRQLQHAANSYNAGLDEDGMPGPLSWGYLRVAFWG
ncbi:peptidoglycan-binding domain-containing protein [Streptomyces sp. AK02-01A]|uniref:peptidoglycan-binding domain-containing protein n=1 Tax=Streptomyces sp. AK02-01A TaxID=3028648 RepID=UPI0029B00E8C|nr:peptidoglycan-binding domain-containing protein [Streptomyces sp. AK02-01A]MDX3855223.1 peptidoglycan-binding domain-containing protein [Streptomyces sp. AK02-01A]